MAASDKNIVITPNIGSTTSSPTIVFTGDGNDPISLYALDGGVGSLSFEAATGQLFSITNSLTTGSIFTINDNSAAPLLDVDSSGVVQIAPFGGVVAMGQTTVTAGNVLDVKGNVRIDGDLSITGTTLITNLNADFLDGQDGSYYRNASNINAGTIGDAYLPATISSNITGNAATATKLATSRTISITGDGSGSASFDGSANVSISLTISDDSHNHIIGNIDGLQSALDAKAPLASPALTGTPTAPTASAGTNTTQIATTAFVGTAVANLVDSAPTTLDTLNELAAALGDDPNFATTVTNSLATKLSTTTTFGGDVSGTYNAIVVANDSHTHDTRYYTETESDARFLRSDANDSASGALTFSGGLSISNGPGTIASTTFDNGWLRIGTSSLGWTFDSNEFYTAGTCVIGSLSGSTLSFVNIPAFNGGESGTSAPFTVDSTTVVTNLNADTVDGIQGSEIVTTTTITNHSINPKFATTIGFGNDSEILRYNDGTNETRSGYWTNKDGFYIQGDGNNVNNVVLKTGNLDINQNAYIVGDLGVGGNVGIGTTSPDHKLDVRGEVQFIGTTGDTMLGISDDPSYIRNVNDGTDTGGQSILQMGGSISSYVISIQDGRGRVNHSWNATVGSSEEFLVGGENAFWLEMSPDNDGELFKLRKANGSSASAGDEISWSPVFSVDTNQLKYWGGYQNNYSSFQIIPSDSTSTTYDPTILRLTTNEPPGVATTSPGDVYGAIEFAVFGAEINDDQGTSQSVTDNVIAAIKAIDWRNNATSNEDAGIGFYTIEAGVATPALTFRGGFSNDGSFYVGDTPNENAFGGKLHVDWDRTKDYGFHLVQTTNNGEPDALALTNMYDRDIGMVFRTGDSNGANQANRWYIWNDGGNTGANNNRFNISPDQNTNNGITILQNNNVGIGKGSPEDKLHVVGGLTLEAAAPFIKYAETGVTGNPVFWVGQDAGNFSFRLNNSVPYPFQIVTKGANSDAIDYVAIGGETEQARFKVTAATTQPTFVDLTSNANNTRIRFFETSTERWNIGYDIGQNAFTFYDTQASTTRIRIYDGADGGIVIGTDDNGGFTYPTTDSGGAATSPAALRIDGGGHAALFCYNNEQSSDPVAIFAKGNEADDNQVVVIVGDGEGDEELLDIRSNTDPPNSASILSFAQNNANSKFRVYGDGRVYSSYRVGIGLTSPSYPLHTNTNTSNNETISAYFADGSPATQGVLYYNDVILEKGSNHGGLSSGYINQGSDSGLSLGTYNAGVKNRQVWISGTGNVGIGTTNPATKLEVNGSITATGTGAHVFGSGNKTTTINPAGPTLFHIASPNGEFDGILLDMDDDQGSNNFYALNIRLSDNPQGHTDNTNTKFLVNAEGNLLINYGTTLDTGYWLDVNGISRFAGDVSVSTDLKVIVGSDPSTSGNRGIKLSDSGIAGDGLVVASRSGGAARLWQGYGIFSGSSTETSFINADGSAYFDGNVGIGTTDPSTALSVNGYITENPGDGTYWNIVSQKDIGYAANQVPLNQYLGQLAFLDDYSPNSLRREGGGSDDVYVNSSGDVGIGTANPTNKLDINSNSIRIRTTKTPASATATGDAGEICWDANYVYVCVATNTWKRSALNTW